MIGTYSPYSAGFAGAMVDKEFETHGVSHVLFYIQTDLIWCRPIKQLNFIDKEKAKYQGKYYLLSLTWGFLTSPCSQAAV